MFIISCNKVNQGKTCHQGHYDLPKIFSKTANLRCDVRRHTSAYFNGKRFAPCWHNMASIRPTGYFFQLWANHMVCDAFHIHRSLLAAWLEPARGSCERCQPGAQAPPEPAPVWLPAAPLSEQQHWLVYRKACV